MNKTAILLAMFDMAGTTMDDVVEGYPLVIGAMMRAFAQHGIALEAKTISNQRGKEKREMVQALLEAVAGPTALVDPIYAAFLVELDRGLPGVREMGGAREVFAALKAQGIAIGAGSGFPTEVVERIVAQLRWAEEGLLDYYASSEQVGAGRPSPAMIHDAMAKLGVDDPRAVVKIGDTVMDVQEGKNAGVWTVAVLSGTQSREQLAAAGPDAILTSIRDLPEWLETQGLVGRGAR